jgi:hypothetical protein
MLLSVAAAARLKRLPADYDSGQSRDDHNPPIGLLQGCVPIWRVGTGFGLICVAIGLFFWRGRDDGWLAIGCVLIVFVGSLV